jgi:hypothetical protein
LPLSLIAIDCDKDAIASRQTLQRDAEHHLRDIRDALPSGPFDNIMWDAAAMRDRR